MPRNQPLRPSHRTADALPPSGFVRVRPRPHIPETKRRPRATASRRRPHHTRSPRGGQEPRISVVVPRSAGEFSMPRQLQSRRSPSRRRQYEKLRTTRHGTTADFGPSAKGLLPGGLKGAVTRHAERRQPAPPRSQAATPAFLPPAGSPDRQRTERRSRAPTHEMTARCSLSHAPAKSAPRLSPGKRSGRQAGAGAYASTPGDSSSRSMADGVPGCVPLNAFTMPA